MICGRVAWRVVAVYKKKSVGRRRDPETFKCPGGSRYHKGWIQATKIQKKVCQKYLFAFGVCALPKCTTQIFCHQKKYSTGRQM